MNTSKIISTSIVLLSLFLASVALGDDQAGWLNDKVTIRFQDEPMSAVLGKISQQTGISILYDEKLAKQKVTGSYKNVKFSEAINRLFSEKNKSVQVFKNEKKIIVKTFGAKEFILASLTVTDAASVQTPNEAEVMTNEAEVMTGPELKKMHKQQYAEYKKRIADDDSEVFEGGGMIRGELRAMHKHQYEEYKKRIADDDSEVFEGGGMTRGELRVMHKQQYAEYKKRIAADDSEVFEGDGMTRGELRAMHKQQYDEYKKR